jgi:hypothetical protein
VDSYSLAGITSIENSPAIGSIGTILGFAIVGLVGMWFLSYLVRHVEAPIMRAIPFLIIAAFVGLIFMGLFHHLGLWLPAGAAGSCSSVTTDNHNRKEPRMHAETKLQARDTQAHRPGTFLSRPTTRKSPRRIASLLAQDGS